MSRKKINTLHIMMLVIGTLYLASGAFHSNLWFDESYTVGLIHHNIIDLCRIATADVHPHMYYLLLKLFSYVFGESIIALRLFSVLGAALLALLGYTHIRQDFGDKTGFWFSFFVLFMPSTFKYALQIRMYTWAPLFVALAAIYAYRIAVSEKNSMKNDSIFVICSVMAAYCHYYSLIAVALINIILFLYYIIKKINLKKWFILGVIQLALFVPGMYVLLTQKAASGVGWIKVRYPDILFDTISFHFLGIPQEEISVNSPVYIIAMGIAVFIYVLVGVLLVRMIKNKVNTKPALLALVVYLGVIAVFLYISINKPIYYVRYTMASYGLLMFVFAYAVANCNKKYLKLLAAVLIIGISITRAVPIYQDSYAPSNAKIDSYLESDIQDGDVLLFQDFTKFSITVKYQNVPTYFYNAGAWDIEKAYAAFGEKTVITRTLDELKNYKGKIWILGNGLAYEKIMSYSGTKEISRESIQYKYYSKGETLEIICVEKK